MEEVGNRRGYATFLGNMALAMIGAGQLDKAIETFYQSHYELKEKGHIHNAALGLGNIAMCHYLKGEIEEGLELSQKSHQLLLEAKSKRHASLQRLLMCRILIELGRFDEAQEIIEAELKDNQGAEYFWVVVWGEALLSYLQLMQGKAKTALKTIESAQSKVVSDPFWDVVLKQTPLWIWAKILCTLGRYEEALAKLHLGLKTLMPQMIGIDKSDFLTDIGFTLVEQSRYDEAAQRFKQVLERSDKRGGIYFLPRVYHGLALLHHRLNEHEKALDYVNQSLEFSKKMKRVPLLQQTQELQKKIHQAIEAKDKAKAPKKK
jgi:tetratricopeptide (TPR) repeat protein